MTAEASRITLKVLYTLDDGSSYLARSKQPRQVRIANISNPVDSNKTIRIGAISIYLILKEIFINSPEFIDQNNSQHDYNLYYRDICEVDEPLVSLGLLSKIKSKFKLTPNINNDEEMEGYKEYEEEDIEDEDNDEYIVTGRVCSNFTALLRRSYSTSSKNNKNRSDSEGNSITSDTLEIKLKFSKIVNSHSISSPLPKLAHPQEQQKKHYATPTMTTSSVRPTKKRQTNPMPAPRAKRTQSLPIWNLKQQHQQQNAIGLPKNSIAHKIYLADRQIETNEKPVQSLQYEINTLQNDNTIQKIKVDDSVSKRFDFMLNKKKTPSNIGSSPLNEKVVGKKTNKVKKSKTTNKNSNNINNSNKHRTPVIENNSLLNDLLLSQNNPTPVDESEADKENLPPSLSSKMMPPPQTTMNKEIDLSLLNFSDTWLQDFGKLTTPRDIIEDMDKTSPIDTLSMPLMELENQTTNPRSVSCQEQLRKLPLLANVNNASGVEQKIGENSSEEGKLGNKSNNNSNNEESLADEYTTTPEIEGDEEEEKKENRIMPSSPSMMFEYQRHDDLFSSFVDGYETSNTDQFASDEINK